MVIVRAQVSLQPWVEVGQLFVVVADHMVYLMIEEVKVHRRIDFEVEEPVVERRVSLYEVWAPSRNLPECHSRISCLLLVKEEAPMAIDYIRGVEHQIAKEELGQTAGMEEVVLHASAAAPGNLVWLVAGRKGWPVAMVGMW